MDMYKYERKVTLPFTNKKIEKLLKEDMQPYSNLIKLTVFFSFMNFVILSSILFLIIYAIN